MKYPISEGIPIILKEIGDMDKTKEAFGRQWTWQNEEYFEEHTIYGKSEQEELDDFSRNLGITDLRDISGMLILDAGCGSGRLTKNIAKANEDTLVIGIDISDAAQVAHSTYGAQKNVHFIQCDLLHPPFRPKTFHYIWSEGVIHHTPDTLHSFGILDSLLKEKGKLYIWVYPSYKFSPYRQARDVLRKSCLLPPEAVYGLSLLLAIPVYCGVKTLELFGRSKKKHRLSTIVFGFFDNLSPEFQHRHTKEEVEGWFSSRGYSDVRIIGDVGAVGEKTRL